MSGDISIQSMHAKDFLNEPIEYQKSFSRGLRVNCGDMTMLFISGTASIDKDGNTYAPGDFTAQTRRTFDNITALLRSEGATWASVVKTTCYLKDMKYYEVFNQYRNSFYKDSGLNPFPASVCVAVDLCRSELLVEIDAIAVINSGLKSVDADS